MITCMPLEKDNKPQWQALWQESVDGQLTQDIIDHTFESIINGSIQTLLAFDNDDTVGLLHYVVHPVAGCIAPVCFMQDLYVIPDKRREGVATALLKHLKSIAEDNGYDRIYWLLEGSNAEAKSFYKDISVALDFGLYMIPVGMKDRLNLENIKTL